MLAIFETLRSITTVINFVDNVLKLRRLQDLKESNYREQFQHYRVCLSGYQQSIRNIVCLVMEETTSPDETDGIWNSQDEGRWRSADLERKMVERLGRENFEVVDGLMQDARNTVLKITDMTKVEEAETSQWIAAFAQKLIQVIRKDDLTKLFDQLGVTVDLVKTLTGQAIEINGKRPFGISLCQQTEARNMARSLHCSIVSGNIWGCPPARQHELQNLLPNIGDDDVPGRSRIRIRTTEVGTASCQEATINSSPNPPGAVIQIEPDMESAGSQSAEISDQITDMCATLAGQIAADEQQHLGFLTQEGWRHNFSISKTAACNPPHIDLRGNLLHTEDAPSMGMVAMPTFSRQSRLRIAAQLARSTACFQCNWLREGWTSSDIMFLAEERSLEDRHREPFLRWQVMKHPEPDRPHRENPMLSLGLALVELSLCRPIPTPEIPEGEDRDFAQYRTARRRLEEVRRESGRKYAKAVETCLNWSQENTDLDKEETQEEFFVNVTTPLLEVVEEFESSS